MAPWTVPSSRARAVPMAWAAEPTPTPLATGSVMRNRRHTAWAVRLPKMPVRMMTAVVRAGMPPSSPETSAPMAVVTDLGSRLTAAARSIRNAQARARTAPRLTRTPAAMPERMAAAFFRRASHCS